MEGKALCKNIPPGKSPINLLLAITGSVATIKVPEILDALYALATKRDIELQVGKKKSKRVMCRDLIHAIDSSCCNENGINFSS